MLTSYLIYYYNIYDRIYIFTIYEYYIIRSLGQYIMTGIVIKQADGFYQYKMFTQN